MQLRCQGQGPRLKLSVRLWRSWGNLSFGYFLGSTSAIPKPVFSLDQLGQHSLALKSMFFFQPLWLLVFSHVEPPDGFISHSYSHDILDIPGEILCITRVWNRHHRLGDVLLSSSSDLVNVAWRFYLNILGKTPQIQCYYHCVSYSPREKYGYFNDLYIIYIFIRYYNTFILFPALKLPLLLRWPTATLRQKLDQSLGSHFLYSRQA